MECVALALHLLKSSHPQQASACRWAAAEIDGPLVHAEVKNVEPELVVVANQSGLHLDIFAPYIANFCTVFPF